MSVWKRGRFYHYEFQINSQIFKGSTKETDERKARQVERQKREEKESGIAADTELAGRTIEQVFKDYWLAFGRHLSWADTVKGHMIGMEDFWGKDRLFCTLSAADLSKCLEAFASQEGRKNRGGSIRPGRPSPTTVNRRLAVFRKIYKTAKKRWELPVSPIDFEGFALKEPKERVRHIPPDKASEVLEPLPFESKLIIGWLLATGCRKNETKTLKWDRINYQTVQAEVLTKGGGTRFVNLNAQALAILSLCDTKREFVFDFTNLRKRFAAALKAAGVTDFRIHDLRHCFATWLGRATSGNVGVVKEALGHADIATTMKYLHVIQEDVKSGVSKLPILIEGNVVPLTQNRDTEGGQKQ